MTFSLGRRMNWFWLFPVIGAVMLAVALTLAVVRMRFESTALRAGGVVTDLVLSTSSGSNGRSSNTWCPVVRFADDKGVEHTHSGHSCANPPSYAVGERVTVLYAPGNPNDAALDSFLDRWLGALICGAFGVIFSAIGLALVLPMLAQRRRAVVLRVSGRPIMARINDVSVDSSIKVMGRSPWCIHAQWQDGATGKVYVFRSEKLWFNPSPYLSSEIRVLIEPTDPNYYWVDTSSLPEAA